MFQHIGVGVIFKVFILQGCNDMFINFNTQPEVGHHKMQNMGENFRVGLVSGVAVKSEAFDVQNVIIG